MSAAWSRARLAHWLWWSRFPLARAARAALLPLAGLYGGGMLVRAAAYRAGWLKARRLPRPTVAVGNLAVGGTGKTPLASWIARWFAARGATPGVLLRGYGADEPLVHRRLAPGAVVVADSDRVAGAARALEAGATVFVLDDAFQRLDVARDLNIVVLSAEHARAVPWVLPAGPWREGWGALGRADLVVVTRRRAGRDDARRLAAAVSRRGRGLDRPVAVAHLALDHLEALRTGERRELAELAGRRVVAAAGVADPASFAVQLRAARASVQLLAYQDHHPYPEADLDRLVRVAAEADYVVVTEKDAVKLRSRWPEGAREPLVAALAVRWEVNGEVLERALTRLLPARV